MAIASNRRYDRISGDTNYTDPITKNSVNPKEAYYLKPDVSDTKIHHVYHKSTLQRILGSNRKAKSPITRRDFFQSNIREAPRDGYIHPELAGKKFQHVFLERDTLKHTFSAIQPGTRLDYLLSDDNSLTIYKKPGGSSGNRVYSMNVNLTLTYPDKKNVEKALTSLVDVVGQSGNIISVKGNRVYRVQDSK